jgi:predicted O-methyltransferase YrrM
LLLRLVRRHRPNVVVEIGTAYGGTFYALCQVAPSRSTLVSLDLPGGDFGRGYRSDTVALLRRLAKRRQIVHFLPLDSHEPSSKIVLVELLADAQIDFLLIDGDHTYEGVKADFDMYAPLVAEGGLIAFHDVVPGKPKRVGGVPHFWAEVSERFESLEFVKSWKQGGFGIGVVRTPSHAEAADLSRARAWRDAQEGAKTLGGRSCRRGPEGEGSSC